MAEKRPFLHTFANRPRAEPGLLGDTETGGDGDVQFFFLLQRLCRRRDARDFRPGFKTPAFSRDFLTDTERARDRARRFDEGRETRS